MNIDDFDDSFCGTAEFEQIEQTLVEMCRPFGAIRHWSHEGTENGLHKCFVELDQPDKHALVAQRLGARLQNNNLYVEIRLR
jgi:hypothetical protein